MRAHTAEATNLGAGILGAYGIGWYGSVEEAATAMTDVAERFEPDAATGRVYDRLFEEVYRPLFPAVQGPLDRLAEIRGDGDDGGSAAVAL